MTANSKTDDSVTFSDKRIIFHLYSSDSSKIRVGSLTLTFAGGGVCLCSRLRRGCAPAIDLRRVRPCNAMLAKKHSNNHAAMQARKNKADVLLCDSFTMG